MQPVITAETFCSCQWKEPSEVGAHQLRANGKQPPTSTSAGQPSYTLVSTSLAALWQVSGDEREHLFTVNYLSLAAACFIFRSLTFSNWLLRCVPALPANTQLSRAFTDPIKALPMAARRSTVSPVSLPPSKGKNSWRRRQRHRRRSQSLFPVAKIQVEALTHFGVTSSNEAIKTILPGLIPFRYDSVSSGSSGGVVKEIQNMFFFLGYKNCWSREREIKQNLGGWKQNSLPPFVFRKPNFSTAPFSSEMENTQWGVTRSSSADGDSLFARE